MNYYAIPRDGVVEEDEAPDVKVAAHGEEDESTVVVAVDGKWRTWPRQHPMWQLVQARSSVRQQQPQALHSSRYSVS